MRYGYLMTKVLVTGASGFIAKHILAELLEKGYDVRGTIRSDKRKAEIEALFPDADIEFAKLDLMSDEGWDEALEGVDVLLHTASPFPNGSPDDPEEIIRPAVDGTKRAMQAAKTAGVTRVVLTSSCVAIYKDSSKPPLDQSTDANWTDATASFVTPYEASKTLAEKAAWDFANANDMQLTTINPGVVWGPAMDPNFGTSLDLVKQMLNGEFPALPDINLPIVDVRDVTRMHVAAIDNEATFGQRFAANAGAMRMTEIAQTLAAAYPDRKISTRKAPNFVLKIVSKFDKSIEQVIGNLGRNLDVEASKAERTMGFTYIPSKDALLASASYVLDNE